MGGPVQDQYFSAYVPGFVSYIRFNAKHKGPKNVMSAERIKHYLSNPGSKRQDMKRTLIGFTKSDQIGFRLERKCEYKLPPPTHGDNYVKGHSQVSDAIIKRKFKGPLYNEAGKICIELTEKYPVLESFKF